MIALFAAQLAICVFMAPFVALGMRFPRPVRSPSVPGSGSESDPGSVADRVGLATVTDRLGLGFAVAILLLRLVAIVDWRLFLIPWALAAILALRRVRFARPGVHARWLIATLLVAHVVKSIPPALAVYPPGWDPWFHLVLARKVLETHRAIADWTPYEPIALVYPIGSHLLLALTSWATRVPLHVAFGAAIPLFETLLAFELYSLASRTTGSREVALLAAGAWACWAGLGGIDYGAWGGLPSLIALWLLFGILAETAGEAPRAWSIALRFLALSVVHHHGMVTGGVVLGVLVAALALAGDRARAKTLAIGLALAAVAGAPYFWSFLHRAPTVGATGISAFDEPPPTLADLLVKPGLPLILAALAGFALRARRFGARIGLVPVVALATLLVAFAADEWIVRAIAGIAPFTPSRFFTDAIPLLAIPAGIALAQARAATKRPLSAAIALLAIGSLVNARAWWTLAQNPVEPGDLAACEFVREHAAPDALVIDRSIHAAYLAERPSWSLPVPTSEYWSGEKNAPLGDAILAGRVDPATLGREVWQVRAPGDPVPASGRLVWDGDGYQVWRRN